MVEQIRRWIEGLGLWPRMALAISLGFVALFAAVSVLGERALQDSAGRIQNERLVIAQMAAGELDRLLEQAVNELEQARRVADFDPIADDLSAEAHALAHTYGRIGIFATGIAYLDPAGRVLLSQPPQLYPTGTDLTGQPHIAEALQHRAATVSAPFRDPVSRRPVAAVTVPILDGSRFLGLFSGLIDLQASAITDPLEQSATLGQTGHAILVDSQGRTLVSTFDLPFLASGEHFSFYRRAMAGGEPVVDTVPFELDLPGEPHGHPHVMAFAPLKKAPWGVAVGGDVDETFAGVTRLRLGLMVLGVLALVTVAPAA